MKASFFNSGIAALFLAGCGGPTHFETQLEKKIAGHLERIDSVSESILALEAAMQAHIPENPEFPADMGAWRSGAEKSSVPPGERSELILSSCDCTIPRDVFEELSTENHASLFHKLKATSDALFGVETHLRVSAGLDRYGETAKREAFELHRTTPSENDRERRSFPENDAPFGEALERLFRPAMTKIRKEGYFETISASQTSVPGEVQVILERKINYSPVGETFILPVSGAKTDFDSIVVARSSEPSEMAARTIVRMKTGEWSAVSIHPEIDNPNQIVIFFLKINELH